MNPVAVISDIAIVVVAMLLLCAVMVKTGKEKEEESVHNTLFEEVYMAESKCHDVVFCYYRDKLTDVMYVSHLRLDFDYDARSGFTVVMKANGTPMLYDEWIKLVADYNK